MNKVVFENDSIKDSQLNTKKIDLVIEPKNDFFTVNSYKFYIHQSCYLNINYEVLDDCKLNICFYIDANVKLTLFEKRMGQRTKVQYRYYLNDYSVCHLNKFYDVYGQRELDIINLDGNKAEFHSQLKTIGKDKEKYDMMIYHHNNYSSSNIINDGVTLIDGSIIFNVTSVVPNGVKNCFVNQANHIINLNDKKSQINPNLLIDENDVVANHAAYIGNFKQSVLFYLERLGISRNEALKLLVRGFLVKGLSVNAREKEKLKKIIEKYWG
ncbi:MAG: SufD family Fe-S cluster assembly protein [Bacilli bacterium]